MPGDCSLMTYASLAKGVYEDTPCLEEGFIVAGPGNRFYVRPANIVSSCKPSEIAGPLAKVVISAIDERHDVTATT